MREVARIVMPLADRVIVRPLEAETMTKGGIIIPDNAKETPARGEVVAVSTVSDKPLNVKLGDIVVYSKYGGVDTEIDGEAYKVMRETDIMYKLAKDGYDVLGAKWID